MRGLRTSIISLFFLLTCFLGSALAAETVTPNITYKTYIQNSGWTKDISNGQLAGSTGQSKSINAFELNAIDFPEDGDIEYQVYLSNNKWSGYGQSGAIVGVNNDSLSIQAIQIKLTGTIAESYNVYYRIHTSNVGWLDWASNDQIAGTVGFNLPAEAVEVKLISKSLKAPGSTERPSITKENLSTLGLVHYKVYTQGEGWSNVVQNGQEAGTTGQHKALEGVIASLPNIQSNQGGIQYQTYNTDAGWTGWYREAQAAGLPGKYRPIEIFQAELYGLPSLFFDVYYQVHSEDYGWLGWAKNGAYDGTINGDRQVEAIRIVLVPKGGAAPGSTENTFIEAPTKIPAIRRENPVAGPVIYVSIADQKVYYYNANGDLAFKSICTTGTPGTPSATPTGNFTILSKQRNVILRGDDYETPVSFWIPFIGRLYGFHDADGWRTEYGPGVYLYDGSGGCVNMPFQAISTFFNIINVGTPVIIR